MRRIAFLVSVVLYLLSPSSVAAAECQFVLGFATLRDLVGHDIVGECLENEHYNHIGDSVQQTTGGLLVWRKADNWTAFTDGYRTWINGPNGLVQRLNTERFAWEADYAPGGVAATPTPAPSPSPSPTPDATAMVVQSVQNLHWVRDGLTGLEARAVASLQELAVSSPQVLQILLNARSSWLPPHNEIHLASLEQLVSMSAVDAPGVQRLLSMTFLFDVDQSSLDVLTALSTELTFNPSALQQALSHPALGRANVENVAVVASLLSLRRTNPQAAAAIEALPWVRDGIRTPFPLDRGYQFELNRVSDLIDWAHRSPQTFANLMRKPWIVNDFAPFPRTKAVRGVAGDLWADVVIGQPDFSQISDDQVVPFKLFNPGGVVVDRSVSPGRLYVWDAGNSRILGVDLRSCYAGPGPCVADVVIGQPSAFDHAACNADSNLQNFPFRAAASADTLCGIAAIAIPPDEEHSHVTMAVDARGNLYVPDALNNRVLKYVRPFETDTIADEVWGQKDFSGIVCNRDDPRSSPTRETLCFQSWELRLSIGGYASGVEIDPAGNLWVADAANHRVLRFPRNPNSGTIAKQADVVLGQPHFQRKEQGGGLNQLSFPAAVRSTANGWLYVADKGNDRVLVFKPPFTSAMSATSVFGSDFNRPTSLEMHVDNQSIWINDSDDLTFERWELSGGGVKKEEHRVSSRSGGGIGVDTEGNVLISITRFAQDVLRFPAVQSESNNGVHTHYDRQLFSPPGGHNYKGSREMGWVAGVAVYGDQLIAADPKRLMFWNDVRNLRNGQTADGVIGEKYWQQSSHTCCGRIKVDGAGRLWVLGTDTTRFIKVYQLPLTAQSVPIKTIRTDGISIPVLGTNQTVTLGPTTFVIPGSGHRSDVTVTHGPYIRSIAPVGNGEMIWISDSYNHRVMRIRNPLSNPVVDVILGQTEATGNKCNRQAHFSAWDNPEDHTGPPTADMLCFPGGIAYDRLGNLYVSDHSLEVAGNKRLLVFAAGSIPFNNRSVVYAPAATRVVNALGQVERRYFAPRFEPKSAINVSGHATIDRVGMWEPAFDSRNRMAVGFNSYLGPRFVAFYDGPLGPDAAPSGFFHDFSSMPYSVTFDENDNLYVTDINRNRVLIYWNPLSNPRQ